MNPYRKMQIVWFSVMLPLLGVFALTLFGVILT